MIDLLLGLIVDIVPCTIEYSTNDQLVVEQLADISNETGIRFVQSNTPILTFTFKRRVEGVDTYAGYAWVRTINGQLVSGRIHIKNTLPIPLQQTTILHEAGHVLGLSHVNNVHSVMNPYVTDIASLGRGDTRKLKTIAIRSGCTQ